MSIRFVPVVNWPVKPTRNRKRSPFKAPFSRRLAFVERELAHLAAKNVIVQAFLKDSDIRNDGWPRSSARTSSPGVILSFSARGHELSFPCDTYTTWEDNLYAIGLALEALRAVDRYGVTKRAEQYEGWKRLAAPAQEQGPTAEWAIDHLARLADTTSEALRRDPIAIDLAYRAAARKTHPDTGGNTQAFQLLQDAMGLIRGTK